MWFDIQGFTNFTAVHFVTKCHIVNSSQKIPSSSPWTWDGILSFIYYPRFMIIGEARSKDRFKNWRLCGVWQLPFCDHRAVKLTRNCVCFTNPCINLPVTPSVSHEYHPKILELFDLLQYIVTCSTHWLGFLERHNASVYLALILIPAWSRAVENRLNACWRFSSEDASSSKSSAKSKRLILQLPTVTPSSTRLLLPIQFLQTMKRSRDNTHPCRSPTPTVNDCDLTPPIWAQTSVRECSDFKASSRRLSTRCPQNFLCPHKFHYAQKNAF